MLHAVIRKAPYMHALPSHHEILVFAVAAIFCFAGLLHRSERNVLESVWARWKHGHAVCAARRAAMLEAEKFHAHKALYSAFGRLRYQLLPYTNAELEYQISRLKPTQ